MTSTKKIAFAVSRYNRRRKYKRFQQLLSPNPQTKILDVGASNNEYSETINYLERHYPFPERITILNVEDNRVLKARYPKCPCVQYDGEIFPFKDNSFDICWSNAVIEHAGDRNRQILFLKEIKRVAKTAFITTPNKNFPVEVHTRTPFLHFF